MVLLFTLLAFILGSLPFALWIGRLTTGEDIRDFGDHNPGATNVLKAGSQAGFLLALILDVSKGALPVGLAYSVLGIQDWQIIPIALAPTLGHAFSPFLKWRGGKALATSFGVWIGFTIWPLAAAVLGLFILWRLLIKPSGWAVLLALSSIALVIYFGGADPILFAVLAGQAVVTIWMHRQEFHGGPTLRWRYKEEMG